MVAVACWDGIRRSPSRWAAKWQTQLLRCRALAWLKQLCSWFQTPSRDRSTTAPGYRPVSCIWGSAPSIAPTALPTPTRPSPRGDPAWGIVGVSLQRPDQRDKLKPQDCLYTLIERDGDVSRARIVGSVLDVLVAPESPQAVVARMAHADTRIVSLTITEKGYGHDPASGRLVAGHPDIRHDLEHPDQPRSAVGFLVAALSARRAARDWPIQCAVLRQPFA